MHENIRVEVRFTFANESSTKELQLAIARDILTDPDRGNGQIESETIKTSVTNQEIIIVAVLPLAHALLHHPVESALIKHYPQGAGAGSYLEL